MISISAQEESQLLKLARGAIESVLQKSEPPPSPTLEGKNYGAFVTIRLDGKVRGCIGSPYPVKSLREDVQGFAVLAAFEDSRFPIIQIEELPQAEIEISILTPPKPIEMHQIQLGIHGLIVSRGNEAGLLLPHLALQNKWSTKAFVEKACLKAGLKKDAWKNGALLSAFETHVFSDFVSQARC